MSRTLRAEREQTEQRVMRWVTITAFVLGGALLAVLGTNVASSSEPDDVFDASLPNPMGGLARTAPGEATGQTSIGELTIADSELDMGDIGLGVTYVPSWEVVNPTERVIHLSIGMPQVVEGCCPGPIYADGELTQVGQWVSIPPEGSTTLQFPLQMHEGMDGQHHLVIPLATEDDDSELHVSGNFTADAPTDA